MLIAIIGCGNMGGGIAKRLSPHHKLLLYDRNIEKAAALEANGNGQYMLSIEETVERADVIILATKPQNIDEIAGLLSHYLTERDVLVSLLSGVTLEQLSNYFPNCRHIYRMMPNLPLVCGSGIIALSTTQDDVSQKNHIGNLFSSLGTIYWLSEHKINAITALAGSGTAFFYTMIESMIDAGIAMGFSVKESQSFVHQMLKGSLTLLENSSLPISQLKHQVTSPAGTTIAGLVRMEELGLRGAIIGTFLAAYERAQHMKL